MKFGQLLGTVVPLRTDYTSCGSSYPQGTVDIEAARITAPASLTINKTELTDRDGDGDDDTVR